MPAPAPAGEELAPPTNHGIGRGGRQPQQHRTQVPFRGAHADPHQFVSNSMPPPPFPQQIPGPVFPQMMLHPAPHGNFLQPHQHHRQHAASRHGPSIRVGAPAVQSPVTVDQRLSQQVSVRVGDAVLPPPPYTAGGNSQSPIVSPVTPAPAHPTIQPDEALVKQFIDRYSEQEDHEAVQVGATVGFLDVDECLKVIAANDVTFVVTDTGTGKSSLVPNALLKDPNVRIANSQPRRTAAINLAHRVASLRHEKVGETVGFWVRGEHCGDVEKCRLMYMTSYTVLLYIIGHPEDNVFTHIIIDEFHERQPDVEVMLGLLRLAVTVKRNNLKIILMSASVELELWKQYFTGLTVGEYSTCQPRYSIHDYYMEEVCRLVGASCNATKMNPSGLATSLELKNSLHLVKEMLNFLAQKAEPKDSILVFLPGRTVVEEMVLWVNTNLHHQLDPIPWYRDMELAKIQANLKRQATTRKKVYLATDIAEVSLTLPDVVFVIDSGFTKKPRIEPTKRNSVVFPPLELLWCSRSSNRQRRGRVGRVQQGFFFTMVPESYLPDLLEMEPQIANSTIHELVLHTLQVCSNPVGCFNLCRVTPKDVSIQLSMSVLQDGGYVLRHDHPMAAANAVDTPDSKAWRDIVIGYEANAGLKGDTYVTTLKGCVAQRLPLNIESSTMVYLGLVFGVESMMILAAAIAACGSPFYTTAGESDRSVKKQAVNSTSDVMKSCSHGLPSDIISALHVTIQFKKQRALGVSDEGEEQWCREHGVMSSRLVDIIRLEAQIKDQLKEQVSFVDIVDALELESQLDSIASLVSLLSAAAHMERALFVQFDQRRAQREKRVGPSIFLGLDALADLFVASVCPWDVNRIVIPLSIQTRYDKLLGAFATQLQPNVFNVMLLMLAPQVVFETRSSEVLFGVELYGTKLRMKADRRSGADILLMRQTICVKMSILREQLLHKVSPTDSSLDDVLAAASVKLPPSVSKAVSLSPFLRYCTDMIVKTISEDATRNVSPSQDGSFTPTNVSMLVASADGIFDYVPPAVAPPPPAAGPQAPFIESDE